MANALFRRVPHGQLAQPWAVLGGHVISAIIGVTCAQVIANEILAASAAVGLAVGAMYYLGCIHPPGGATALSAVVGGESVHALGYHFVITPVLMNVVVILVARRDITWRFCVCIKSD
jgi:CBS-domain-containing membrane protein